MTIRDRACYSAPRMGCSAGASAPTHGRWDWLFLGFLVFSVLTFGWTVVRRWQLATALRTYAECAAQADVGCAGRALERVRQLEPDSLRARFGKAQMHALLGEAQLAVGALDETLASVVPRTRDEHKTKEGVGQAPVLVWGRAVLVKHQTPSSPKAVEISPDQVARLPSDLRGDVLLVLGDIAALQGDPSSAEARWTEAAAVVDEETIVRPRRDRLRAKLNAQEQQRADELSSLRADFGRLFAAARTGADASFPAKVEALRQRVMAVADEGARTKLLLALGATRQAERNASGGRSGGTRFGRPRPEPPDPQWGPQGHTKWALDFRRHQLENYQREVARWERERDEADASHMAREAAASAEINRLLEEARALVDEGLTAGPAGDAP